MRQDTFNHSASQHSSGGMMSSLESRDTSDLLPIIGGGLLLFYGLGRLSLMRTATLLFGGYLLYDGITRGGGVRNFFQKFSDQAPVRSGYTPVHKPTERAGFTSGTDVDIVKEASEESFPASDAPSWTPTTSIGSSKI